MPADAILQNLKGVKACGDSKWQARCPAHDDEHASLSIKESADGTVLVHCHAGCTPEAICAALGITIKDLFPKRITSGSPEIVATYDYRDHAGQLLYQVVRYAPKAFKQRRPDGKGGWTWNLEGVARVLYRLPEILASDPQDWLFVCEGEKDANNVARLGLLSTTASQGAGKWHKLSDDSALNGRKIILFPHKDAAGQKHMADIALRLYGRATEIRIVNVHGSGKDVSDWIESCDTQTLSQVKDMLLAKVAEGPVWHRPPEAVVIELVGGQKTAAYLSDMGNAARFIRTHGDVVRYCPTWGRWLIWDGIHWGLDDTLRVYALAKGVALGIFDEAKRCSDIKGQQAVSQHAMKTQQRERLTAMLELAKPELSVAQERLDSSDWLLNCTNGTLNLQTGELYSHRQADMLTRSLSVAYEPDAIAPRWLAFLATIMSGNAGLIEYLRRLIGYCLTGNIEEQHLWILWGQGQNGKTTFLNAIKGVMGPYATEAAPHLLTETKWEEHPTAIADLQGVRLLVASETDESRRLKLQFVKHLTGDETLKARRMRQDYYEFRRTHKTILVTNNRPVVQENNKAVWRRIRLIPFGVVIPDTQVDKKLGEKLKDEYPGILAWCVNGCRQWLREGLSAPTEVLAATEQYKRDQDILGDFLEECITMDAAGFLTRDALYDRYTDWSGDRKDRRTLSRRTFYDRIRLIQGVSEDFVRLNGQLKRLFCGISFKTIVTQEQKFFDPQRKDLS